MIVNINRIIIRVKINNQELLIRKQNDSNATSKCIDFIFKELLHKDMKIREEKLQESEDLQIEKLQLQKRRLRRRRPIVR